MSVRCEVLVVGGGVAGVPAAVAAARAGADTLLVETRSCPGGTGVAGLHRFICGLYPNRADGAAPLLNGGLAEETCRRLTELAPSSRPIRLGRVDVLPYDPAHLRKAFLAMIAREERLRVRYETAAEGCVLDGGRIRCVRAGGLEILPDTVVDCSGTGAVIRTDPALHDAPPATERQMDGYTVRVSGLTDTSDALPIQVPLAVRRGVEAGELPDVLRFTTFVAGDRSGEGWCKLNLPAGQFGDAEARVEAGRLHAYLKRALAPFGNSRLTTQGSEVTEREGSRLKGVYTLTERDVLDGRTFADGVVRGAWPIEIWDAVRGPASRYLEPGRTYSIPARCLQAAASPNLFCAGRCISVTHTALGSTRVMGTCLALGEAAGALAARRVRRAGAGGTGE